MTRTIVKIDLPNGIGNGKLEYKARTVVFTDIEGNVFYIPDTLIDRLYGYLSNKREELAAEPLVKPNQALVEAREFAKETLVKPAKALPEPPTKKSPTPHSRRTIHEGD